MLFLICCILGKLKDFIMVMLIHCILHLCLWLECYFLSIRKNLSTHIGIWKNLKRISYCIRGYPIFIFHFNLWFSRNDTTFLLKDWGVVMGVSIFIIMAMSNLKVKAFLNKSVFVYLGEISYSIYLCHFPIMMVLFKLLYTKIPIFFLLTLCIAMTLLFL